jgi:hypothetical protein
VSDRLLHVSFLYSETRSGRAAFAAAHAQLIASVGRRPAHNGWLWCRCSGQNVCIAAVAPTPPLLNNWQIVMVTVACGVFVGISILSVWTYRSYQEQKRWRRFVARRDLRSASLSSHHLCCLFQKAEDAIGLRLQCVLSGGYNRLCLSEFVRGHTGVHGQIYRCSVRPVPADQYRFARRACGEFAYAFHDNNSLAHDCNSRKKRAERKAVEKAQRVPSARPRPGSSAPPSDLARPRLSGSPAYPDIEGGLAKAPLQVYEERDEEYEDEDQRQQEENR